MTDLDLEAIKARADAATPGPWDVQTPHVHMDGTTQVRVAPIGKPKIFVDTMSQLDAEFIAHARADVPALLARIAELEAERRRSPAENGEACDAPWPGRTPHQCVLPGGHHVHWDGKGDAWLEVRSEDQVLADVAAAERRGYERAVARLRDRDAFHAWRHPDPAPWQRKPEPREPNVLAADYLDAIREVAE
jgi:hypothetical protein